MTQPTRSSKDLLDAQVKKHREELQRTKIAFPGEITQDTKNILSRIYHYFNCAKTDELEYGYIVRIYPISGGFRILTSDRIEGDYSDFCVHYPEIAMKEAIKIMKAEGYKVEYIFLSVNTALQLILWRLFEETMYTGEHEKIRHLCEIYSRPHWEITYIPPEEDI